MPLSDCTRSSSEGSRPRPCCRRPIPPPCCSGHCSLPDRSTCARSMAGKRSPPSQSISRLTSPHDQIPSSCWRSRRGNSYHIPDGTGPNWHPVSWLRRADRSSISSFHLADSAGKLSILRYSVSVFSCCEWDYVKPSPRSHRRSLTQGGERRWRRDGGHPFGEPERAFVRHGRGPSARRLDRGRELPNILSSNQDALSPRLVVR